MLIGYRSYVVQRFRNLSSDRLQCQNVNFEMIGSKSVLYQCQSVANKSAPLVRVTLFSHWHTTAVPLALTINMLPEPVPMVS